MDTQAIIAALETETGSIESGHYSASKQTRYDSIREARSPEAASVSSRS